MEREDHRPCAGSAEQAGRSPEEMLEVCGRTLAFVKAFGGDCPFGANEVAAAIAAARHARMAAVFVLADAPHVQDAREAMLIAGSRGRTMVQAVEYDEAAAAELTRDAGGFELFGLPFGLLETARVIADSVMDDYDGVVIMDASQAEVTADHLYELCLDRSARPEAEAITLQSQAEPLRRTPLLLTPALLDRLEARDPTLRDAVHILAHQNSRCV